MINATGNVKALTSYSVG